MNKRKKSIGQLLVVEDCKADVDLITHAIKDLFLNIHIKFVSSAELAIELLDNSISHSFPDLVLLDLNLPGMSGDEFLIKVRTKFSLEELPVVIWSSGVDEEKFYNLYCLDANCCLKKPMHLSDYVFVIQKIVDFWIRKNLTEESVSVENILGKGQKLLNMMGYRGNNET